MATIRAWLAGPENSQKVGPQAGANIDAFRKEVLTFSQLSSTWKHGSADHQQRSSKDHSAGNIDDQYRHAEFSRSAQMHAMSDQTSRGHLQRYAIIPLCFETIARLADLIVARSNEAHA